MNFTAIMVAAISGTDGSEETSLVEFERSLFAHNDPRLIWELFEPVRRVLLHRIFEQAKWNLQNSSEAAALPGDNIPMDDRQFASDELSSPGSAALFRHDIPISNRQPDPGETNSEAAALFNSETPCAVSQSASEPQSSEPAAQKGYDIPVDASQSGSGDPDRVSVRAVIAHYWTGNRPRRNARTAIAAIHSIGSKKPMFDKIHNRAGISYSALTGLGLEAAEKEAGNPVYRIYAKLLRERLPQTNRDSDRVRNFISVSDGDDLWLEATRLARETEVA